ncbi:hypothetical protein ES703_120787 [subsurface metagenome]
MRRIFTKVFDGSVEVVAGLLPVDHNAIESWLAQEPIEVIGAEVIAHNGQPCENDGQSKFTVELSQVGIARQDGAILAANALEHWNTTPAGIATATGHAVVTFPAGYTVPVKEEGYLYVNAWGTGKTADSTFWQYVVIVYYTKKGH